MSYVNMSPSSSVEEEREELAFEVGRKSLAPPLALSLGMG